VSLRSCGYALCTELCETSAKIAAGFVLLHRDYERGRLPITCLRVVRELLSALIQALSVRADQTGQQRDGTAVAV